jgi:hypothetical protein
VRRLEWGEGNTREVNSAQDLQNAIEQLEAEARARPFMVELFVDDHGSLCIGLGRSKSVVNFTSVDGNPPYFQSVGSPDEDEDIDFFYGGDWSDFPGSSAIPIDDARRAMIMFFETGVRPSTIRWQEV